MANLKESAIGMLTGKHRTGGGGEMEWDFVP